MESDADAPDDLDEVRARIRRLLDPYRDREDDLSPEKAAKVQVFRDSLTVIGEKDRDNRPHGDDE